MNFFNRFIYSKDPWIRISRHVLFWSADIINYFLVISINTEITATEVYRILFRMPLIIAGTYFILYFLIPRFSQNPNRVSVYLWILGILLYLGIVVRFYQYYILTPIIEPGRVITFNIWDFRRVLSDILQAMVVVSLAIAIKVIKSKTELEQKNEALKAEKKAAELNFLKAQMHPHFLFNTLNTLYSDAIKEDDQASQLVLRLSSLLRFILEECNKPFITIEKELKVIEDYLALEKLRHGNRLAVDFNVSVENRQKLISPLLLLPFIENSCKHTLSSIRGPILVTVTVKSEAGFVTLFVENALPSASAVNGKSLGMGVANIKRQLHLLYDSNFKLDINKANSMYSVYLKIPTF